MTDNKSLLAIMHAATLRSKTQQGLVNLIWKFSFWCSTHTKAGKDEQPLRPSGRNLAEVWSGILLYPYRGVVGSVESISPLKLTAQFRSLYPVPSPGISCGALSPTKQWQNFGISELKPFVRKQNPKGMAGADLPCIRPQEAFSGGHLSHSPGRG